MTKVVRTLALVLSCGAILYLFSEFMFWSGGMPDTWSPVEMAPAWLLYSLLAYCFLAVVRLGKASAWAGLFLAGATFGWLAEGVMVQTMVEQLPLSISWTGLAWHALLTVGVGWYGLRRALLDERAWLGPLVAVIVGLVWGTWAISWWTEVGGIHLPPVTFATGALAGTLLLILAHAVFEASRPADFRPEKIGLIGAGGFIAVWFIVVAVPSAPLTAVVVPVMLVLAGWGIWRLRGGAGETPDAIDAISPRVGLRLLWLLLIPLGAAAAYTAADALGLYWYTSMALYAITTPLGLILLGASLWRAMRETRQPETSYSQQ